MVVEGCALQGLSEDELSAWRDRRVGVVFQSFQLLPTLSVLENVCLPMDLCGTLATAPARTRALELLSSVGIADQAHQYPWMRVRRTRRSSSSCFLIIGVATWI